MPSLKSLLIVAAVLVALAGAAPTQEDLAKELPKNIVYYVIGALIVVGLIVVLLCWTAAKGCCCLIKIGLLVGCVLLLFYLIVQGTIDYKQV